MGETERQCEKTGARISTEKERDTIREGQSWPKNKGRDKENKTQYREINRDTTEVEIGKQRHIYIDIYIDTYTKTFIQTSRANVATLLSVCLRSFAASDFLSPGHRYLQGHTPPPPAGERQRRWQVGFPQRDSKSARTLGQNGRFHPPSPPQLRCPRPVRRVAHTKLEL